MFTLTGILLVIGYFGAIWILTVLFSYLDRKDSEAVKKIVTKKSVRDFLKK